MLYSTEVQVGMGRVERKKRHLIKIHVAYLVGHLLVQSSKCWVDKGLGSTDCSHS